MNQKISAGKKAESKNFYSRNFKYCYNDDFSRPIYLMNITRIEDFSFFFKNEFFLSFFPFFFCEILLVCNICRPSEISRNFIDP